jgi:hypothetical protein
MATDQKEQKKEKKAWTSDQIQWIRHFQTTYPHAIYFADDTKTKIVCYIRGGMSTDVLAMCLVYSWLTHKIQNIQVVVYEQYLLGSWAKCFKEDLQDTIQTHASFPFDMDTRLSFALTKT